MNGGRVRGANKRTKAAGFRGLFLQRCGLITGPVLQINDVFPSRGPAGGGGV